MIIGIDFDNTIVRWDELFYEAAIEKKIIPNSLSATKGNVRNYLRQIGKEDAWTELQGYVYGILIQKARMFPGVRDFFVHCRERNISVYIISHKTRFPFLGEKLDLHQAANNWLEAQGFYDLKQIGLPRSHVFWEPIKQDKLNRISQVGCTHFIDDLPEFLLEPSFPQKVDRILFDPNNHYENHEHYHRAQTWNQIEMQLIGSATDSTNSEIKSIVASLLTSVKLPADSFQPIMGGANNKIFSVGSGDRKTLLKIYFQHPDDSRDRLHAEFSFSQFAWNHDIHAIPKPLAQDLKNHCALYEFIEGRRLEANEISKERIFEALNFYLKLNQFQSAPEAKKLPKASEACFSINQHLQCVEKRIHLLKLLSDSSQINGEVSSFIQHELYPAWLSVTEQIQIKCRESGIGINDMLREQGRCISPSDFGFHNALLDRAGNLRFIDFEYAGWDDPAKLVCDFFCQPAIPVPFDYFKTFAKRVTSKASHPPLELKRVILLFPLYQIKWCCILLNDFVPVGKARRDFAGGETKKEPDLNQLNKARKMLRKLSEPIRVN